MLANRIVKNDYTDNEKVIVIGVSVPPEIIKVEYGLSKHENALGIIQITCIKISERNNKA